MTPEEEAWLRKRGELMAARVRGLEGRAREAEFLKILAEVTFESLAQLKRLAALGVPVGDTPECEQFETWPEAIAYHEQDQKQKLREMLELTERKKLTDEAFEKAFGEMKMGTYFK